MVYTILLINKEDLHELESLCKEFKGEFELDIVGVSDFESLVGEKVLVEVMFSTLPRIFRDEDGIIEGEVLDYVGLFYDEKNKLENKKSNNKFRIVSGFLNKFFK